MRAPALVAAAVAAAITVAAPAQAQGDPLVVGTDKGEVRGFREAPDVEAFLGIPYAAAPVGDRRWEPPAAAETWTGVRDATAFGDRCAAAASTNGPRTESEDCLFVNVWRPRGVNPNRTRAVYVFIHGGGFVNGSSNQADMTEIVQRTGVVGVSMNYRLGPFGFLSLPGLTAEQGESGNYGVLDQQAALRWVRDNIGAFGGRPDEVTLGGESAGAMSVCAHLVSPGSRGLFDKAMLQSGSCPSRTQAEAETGGADFAAALGCTDAATLVSCMRAKPPGALLDAPWGFGAPVRGTPFLPQDPREAIATGDFARVPVVVGANRDEGRTFALDVGMLDATQEQYEAWVRGTFGDEADAILARYAWPADAGQYTSAYLVGAIITDSGLFAGIGGCPTLDFIHDFAAHTRTYAYEFAARSGPGLRPIPGYVWGAGHAIELAYLFPSFDNGVPITPMFDAGERRLAIDIKRYWGAFVRTGAPKVNAQQRWPAYDLTGAILSLRPGGRSALIRDSIYRKEHGCAFWDAL